MVFYPDCDGKPIAENTIQFEWVVTIKGNLDLLFLERADVFVAGDLLWYPVEGYPKICTAPDAMVALGRPKGHRPSYKQWEEGGIPPQVVFEVLSHRNRPPEMRAKLAFYERYGVQEYYIYDPQTDVLTGYQRIRDELIPIPDMKGWTSPLLQIGFDVSESPMRMRYPDGKPFLTLEEIAAQRDDAVREREIAEREREIAERERNRIARELEVEREKAARMAAKLREMGIEP